MRQCPLCGSSWTIDDSDREWTTPDPYCMVCDINLPPEEEMIEEEELPPPQRTQVLVEDDQVAADADEKESSHDSHERWDAQGRSLSNADGSISCDDNDSDDDHLANACPAIDHTDNWAEWEDTVE